jgi:hypothetical protein
MSGVPRLLRFHVLAAVVLPPLRPASGADGCKLEQEASGYFQNLGLTAQDEDAAVALVEGSIADGEVAWSESQVRRLDEAQARTLCGTNGPSDPEAFRGETSGVWYRSGRVLY